MNFFRGSAPPTLAWLDWSHCSKRYNGLRLLFYLIVIVCQSSLHLDLDVTIRSRFQIANQINLDQLTLVCDLQILLCSQIVNQINISPILVRFPNLFASEKSENLTSPIPVTLGAWKLFVFVFIIHVLVENWNYLGYILWFNNVAVIDFEILIAKKLHFSQQLNLV